MSKQTDLINIPDAITVSGSKVGIGTSTIGGSSTTKLHLMSATTSSPTVANDADELIIEGTGSSGMTFLSTTSSNIRFGDAADSSVGQIRYTHSDNSLMFGANNSEAMRIDSSGNVGILNSVASTITTANSRNGLVVGSGSGNNGVTIYSGNTSNSSIMFADATSGSGTYIGQINYDHNADAMLFSTTAAERMRIDSSGNLLIGTSVYNGPGNASSGDYGVALREEGILTAGANASESLILNRMNSDGDLATFKRSGSTVGSIGVYSSDNLYLQGKSDHSGLAFGEAEIYGFRGGSENDGVTSLGSAAGRFKDLYLSGGVYLGGTGSANKLDDYEEGTYSPEKVNGGTVNYSQQNGWYIKVGNLVTVYMDIVIDSASGESGNAQITLPFTSQSGNSYMAFNPWIVDTGYTSTTKKAKGFVNGSSNRMQMYRINSGNSSGSSYAYQNVTGRWSGVIQYFTA